MKKLFLFGVLFFTLTFNALAVEKKRPSFEFTADDKIPDTGELDIKKSTEILDDEFWSQPLTKLEYILMQFKHYANLKTEEIINSRTLVNNFEKLKYRKELQDVFGIYEQVDIENFVFFDENSGKINAGFKIDNLGKPKRAMSEICENILRYDIMIGMPTQDTSWGYLNHNYLLNEIYKGDGFDIYTKHLNKIANNLSYSLELTSRTVLEGQGENIFTMYCFKKDESSDFKFRKYSYTHNFID